MPAIFFNYQSSTASAILKPCIDLHFSTYVFLRLTCFQDAGLPSGSSCAKSMSWWLQNPLKFQFSTLLKILQPSFGKAKLIPMALFVYSIISCVSYKAFWWKWFFECIAPGIELNTIMQWLLLPSMGIFHQNLNDFTFWMFSWECVREMFLMHFYLKDTIFIGYIFTSQLSVAQIRFFFLKKWTAKSD